MNYFLGGYYLIKVRPASFGSVKNRYIQTCSSCINDSLLEDWAYSWDTQNDKNLNEIISLYKIQATLIPKIRNWVDLKLEEGKIGWVNLFRDLQSAQTYQEAFFSHLKDIKLMAIYFDTQEMDHLIDDFNPENDAQGNIGLYQNLKMRIPEIKSANEKFIGYDIIGIELDGNFHTFHCHDLANQLATNFNIHTNEFGLYNSIPNMSEVLDFMNNEDNGFEPVPWFIVKTTQILA